MENYKLFFLIFSWLTFQIYNAYIVHAYGMQKSFSDAYYADNKSPLFYIVLALTGIPLMFVAQTFLMTVATTFMVVVGAAPGFKEPMEKEIHVVAAVGCISIGLLSLYLDFGQVVLPLIAVTFIVLTTMFKMPNKTYWNEVVAYFIIVAGILVHQLS